MKPLEKVFRLMALLDGLNSHPFLRTRIVLKGGTAFKRRVNGKRCPIPPAPGLPDPAPFLDTPHADGRRVRSAR
jgi:hypothetical protein